MSQSASLLQAILADPDDDTPRLIFADWLEEQGDPRSELIRVQCELARWVPDLDRRRELQQRERELLAACEESVRAGLRRLCQRWRREKGFARITVSTRQFLARTFAPRAAERMEQALVECVHLRGCQGKCAALARAPHLASVLSLSLDDNQLEDEDFAQLLASPHLQGLTRLSLANNRLTNEAVRHVMTAVERLPNLVWLDLRNNLIRTAGQRTLLNALLRRQLRWLDLHGNPLRPTTQERWLRWLSSEPRQGSAPRSGQTAEPGWLINSIGMQLVRIPAGTFLMGSPPEEPDRFENEGPMHRVTLTQPLYLGVYPVTQQQYQTVMRTNPSHFHGRNGGGPNFPVDNVSWEHAVDFCQKLSELPAEREAGRLYRLPTEAEWEHACRAGTTTPFSFGEVLTPEDANYNYRQPYRRGIRRQSLGRTTPVGLFAPNPFGLYDMHGNVQEWVADFLGPYKKGARTDPEGPAESEMRGLRGGSYWVNGTRCRSARRNAYHPHSHNDNYGFRVACSL